MKILELTTFSDGICGVWTRVKQEAKLLSKKHEVRVFSSDSIKGCNEKKSKAQDQIGKVKIFRFPSKKLGGESFSYWKFEKEAFSWEPDVIIAHNYRHLHTTKALKIAKKLRSKKKDVKVFLVTHAPFVEERTTRSGMADQIVKFYDKFIGKRTINKFDKVISITNWELPHLEELNVKKEKIVYIPNGIPNEFFKRRVIGKGILFFGRISPIKNLETLILAMKHVGKNRLDIIGPGEKDYLNKLKTLIKKEKIKNVRFKEPVYDLKKKIGLIDNYEIFALPSKREAMPQALIEIMARGKIVISSKTKGGMEIIKNRKTGFLFDIGDEEELARILNKMNNLPQNEKEKIRKAAIKRVEQFKWDNLIKGLEELF